MRWRLLQLALLTVLMCNAVMAGGEEALVNIDVVLDPPYLVEQLRMELTKPTSTLRFNLSGYTDRVELALASTGEYLVEGRVEGNFTVFEFTSPVSKVDVVFVFRNVTISGRLVVLELPLLLAPLDVAANYTVLVHELPSEPNIANSTVSLGKGFSEDWRHYLRGNGTAEPGSLGLARLYTYLIDPSPKVDRLDRTVLVESYGEAVVIDNMTLVGVAEGPSTRLELAYPPYCEVVEVRGILGPYPPTSYRVTRSNESLKLSITLRAPPYKVGDRTYLEVVLRVRLEKIGEVYMLPAFMGIGHYVPRLHVRVNVRGEAVFEGIKPVERVEGEFTVYELGNFKLINELYGIKISASFKLRPRPIPPYIPAGMAVAVIVAVAGYLMRSRGLREEKEAVIEALKPASELVELLEERRRLLESMIENWRKLEERSLSRHAYRQVASRLRRREEELRRATRNLLKKESGEVVRMVREFDIRATRVINNVSRMEDLLRRAGRGLISKRDYRREVSVLEKEVEKALLTIDTIIRKLS